MPLTRRHFLSTSAASLAMLMPRKGMATASRPAFRRGGAIHTMMNWGTLQSDDPATYLSRPFETPRNDFPAGLIADFASLGFDFIRLTLDVGPFLQLQHADREVLDQKLVSNIQRFHDLGLGVIIDCHPVEQVPLYSAPSILDDLEGTLFADYAAMIARLATLLASIRTGPLALELMNEPVVRDASHRIQVRTWGAAQLFLHDAARRAAPDLPLILTGADYGGISGLSDLDPSPFLDSNVHFSFHYYMPLSFTHQGIDFGTDDAPASPYVVDLPYPYDAVSAADIAAMTEARIARSLLTPEGKAAALNQARRIMDGFLSDAWNRQRIESDFARVSLWADKHNVARERILLGECDVTRRVEGFIGAADVYRKRWLSDVTHTASANGFGWALWEINSREMGIDIAGDANRIDRRIVDVLAMSG